MPVKKLSRPERNGMYLLDELGYELVINGWVDQKTPARSPVPWSEGFARAAAARSPRASHDSIAVATQLGMWRSAT
jgi:hypothetical protein